MAGEAKTPHKPMRTVSPSFFDEGALVAVLTTQPLDRALDYKAPEGEKPGLDSVSGALRCVFHSSGMRDSVQAIMGRRPSAFPPFRACRSTEFWHVSHFWNFGADFRFALC